MADKGIHTEKHSEEQVKHIDINQRKYDEAREKASRDIDLLKMYLKKPYVVNDQITIYQPTIGQIIEFGDNKQYGEKEFYSTVNIFVSNPTSYRLQLWKMGIDWNKISDFELFSMLVTGVHEDVQKILFGDNTNFKALKPYGLTVALTEDEKQEEKYAGQDSKTVMVLYDKESQLIVDEETYQKIVNYMRVMFNIFPKVEKAKGRTTKEWIIQEEEEKLALGKKNKETSMLLPLISSCINHPGFKYRASELDNVGIVEFMDAVQRLQVYENTRALLAGSMSGMCDMSRVDREEFNFMRSLL